jgi:hypothetical protein
MKRVALVTAAAMVLVLCVEGCDDSGGASSVRKSWTGPVLVETYNAGNAYYPQVAMDRDGNAMAVWQQSDGTIPVRYDIWANRYDRDAGWGQAELVEWDNAGSAIVPQVAMDRDGNAMAVWQQSDGTGHNIMANRYVKGHGWGVAELIESAADNAFSPQVAMDERGNAIALWQQNGSPYSDVWSNRYERGVGWGVAMLMETNNVGDAQNPQVAMDGQGNAIALWQEHDGTRENIVAKGYLYGTGWGSNENLETGSGAAINPHIALNDSGNAMAVWQQYDGTRYNIMANRHVAGSGWGGAALIETGTGAAEYPRIALDGQGNAMAVWRQVDGAYYRIRANRYSTSASWGDSSPLEMGIGNAFSPRIVMDRAGNALAVWHQYNGSINNVWTNKYSPSLEWSIGSLFEDDDAGYAEAPQVAMDFQGNAVVVWHHDDGDRYNILAKHYR